MFLQANLECVLNNVNKFINIDVHRQYYAEHFTNLKNIVFKHLRANEVFGYMFNGFQLGGSYGDNVKVSIPNEFDLVFHIKFPEQSLIIIIKDDNHPGNVFLDFTNVIKKICNEEQHQNNLKYLKQWLDENNFLRIEKFQLFIQSCFMNVLTQMQNQITFNGKTSTLRYKRQGPAHTIHVQGSLDFDYSVDFVPGILFKNEQRIFPSIEGQWEAIPKPIPKNHHNNTSFRTSYYRQEQLIIKNKKQLKNVYRMLKKFRDNKTNMIKLKSYYIKTLFLYKATLENFEYWTKPLSEIIIDMFMDLESSLRKGNLPFFWHQNLNLYEHYSDSLLTEMLTCVESSRKVLVKAAIQLTMPLQNRVYCIFLNANERKLLDEQKTIADAFDDNKEELINSLNIKIITNKLLSQEDNDDGATEVSNHQQNSASRYRCVVS